MIMIRCFFFPVKNNLRLSVHISHCRTVKFKINCPREAIEYVLAMGVMQVQLQCSSLEQSLRFNMILLFLLN